MNNLETYLRKNCEQNIIDHALRAEVAADGTVSFYIHPNGVDGETRDYRVAANTLTPKFGVAEPNAGERFDCKRWLDALTESIESAEKIKVPLYEADDELHTELLLLQENLKELRRQIESASNEKLSDR